MSDANVHDRSPAEETDATKLGETVGESDPPGESYPPDKPLGVDDPSILEDGSIAPDDVESRSERERPEVWEKSEPRADKPGRDLFDPSADPDQLDDTAQMVATESDDFDSAAEVAAVHQIPTDRLR